MIEIIQAITLGTVQKKVISLQFPFCKLVKVKEATSNPNKHPNENESVMIDMFLPLI